MSMRDYPIMMFGVNACDIGIKPEYWMPWDKTTEDAEPPKYDSLYDFVENAVNDFYIVCDGNEYNDYIGIFAGYEWNMPANKRVFDTKEEAAKHIAEKLAPFCKKSEAEIESLCTYIEDTYFG